MIPVAEILAKTLKKGPTAKKIKEQFIIDAWPEVVGEHIAQKSEASVMEKGVLSVKVSDSVWAQHLTLQKKQIITKMNRTLQTRLLTDIRFHIGKLEKNDSRQSARQKEWPWRQEGLTNEELAVIEESFAGTSLPPELQNSMKALFIAQKKRQNWSVKEGEPVCSVCGLPLVQTAKETYCMRCKTEDFG